MTGQLPPRIVLDASVLINLLSTGCLREIIQCLPEEAIAVGNAFGEVIRDPRTGQAGADLLTPYVADGTLSRVELEPNHAGLFVELTGAEEPDDLDDGEAATIAWAALSVAGVGLDDNKPMRICAARFPACKMSTTVDLLRRPEVLRELGHSRLAEAVHDALRFGRMRVHERNVSWVVDLVGVNRVQACPCLRQKAIQATSKK